MLQVQEHYILTSDKTFSKRVFKKRKINLKKNVLNLKMLHFHGIKNDHLVHLILICCYCSCAINIWILKSIIRISGMPQ